MNIGVVMSLGSTYQPVIVEVDDKLLKGKKRKERAEIIKAAINQSVIDNMVVIIGPVVKASENFPDSDFAIKKASFGDATWAADDIRMALRDRGYSDGMKNVRLVIANCNKINDSMVEAGWNHIECVIDDNAKSLVKARKK